MCSTSRGVPKVKHGALVAQCFYLCEQGLVYWEQNKSASSICASECLWENIKCTRKKTCVFFLMTSGFFSRQNVCRTTQSRVLALCVLIRSLQQEIIASLQRETESSITDAQRATFWPLFMTGTQPKTVEMVLGDKGWILASECSAQMMCHTWAH